MGKVTVKEITDLGFKTGMFAETNADLFKAFIEDIITEQTAILEGRIGSTDYASTTSPTKEYVKQAEKYLVAAEMLQRRINIILEKVVGAGEDLDTRSVEKQMKLYQEKANAWIQKIADGVTSDSGSFASAVLETSHFEDPATIAGLET